MPKSLTLAEFKDHDLLFAIEESSDDEGWASSADIATHIGISGDKDKDVTPAKYVGARLAWMNRFGFMEKRTEKGVTEWRLNDVAYDLMHPNKLSPAVERALANLSEGQRAQITDAIAKELPRGSRQAAHLARRTWQHRFGNWRDASIAPQREK